MCRVASEFWCRTFKCARSKIGSNRWSGRSCYHHPLRMKEKRRCCRNRNRLGMAGSHAGGRRCRRRLPWSATVSQFAGGKQHKSRLKLTPHQPEAEQQRFMPHGISPTSSYSPSAVNVTPSLSWPHMAVASQLDVHPLMQ